MRRRLAKTCPATEGSVEGFAESSGFAFQRFGALMNFEKFALRVVTYFVTTT